MGDDLRAIGARIDDIRYCPHHPDAGVGAYRLRCSCRKPAPGMILDLLAHWPVDAAASLMIGDKEIDAQAGRAAGISAEIVPGGELESVVDRFLRGRRAELAGLNHTSPSSPGQAGR